MDGVLFVRSISVLLSLHFLLMLCSPVNFHRQTEAEGVEVIAVCITAILPLIEQWPHVCRYSALSYIRYAVCNGAEMGLPIK